MSLILWCREPMAVLLRQAPKAAEAECRGFGGKNCAGKLPRSAGIAESAIVQTHIVWSGKREYRGNGVLDIILPSNGWGETIPPHVRLRHLQKTIPSGGKAVLKDEFKNKFLRLVTRQEKARRKRARNRAQEDAAAKQLSEETVWDTTTRKRAASNTAEPKIAKKAKAPSTAGADTMDLGDQQPAKEKKSSKKTPAGKKTPKTKSGNEGLGKEPGAQKRSEEPSAKKRNRYLPNIINDSDDDEPATQVYVRRIGVNINAPT
ncbi:hypothetical protein B0H13DRAFT_1854711 [Mycena leptocephala]|nr:hypothetical protein B0H13DRAFT_1854711 [Mycena leptocephala]